MGWARVTAMSLPFTRDQAWDLFCEWTQSPSLRKHVRAVEAGQAFSFDADPTAFLLAAALAIPAAGMLPSGAYSSRVSG